jgi:WD40 repeat protein
MPPQPTAVLGNPTAAPAEPTPVPTAPATDDIYPADPVDVVRAFLTDFGNPSTQTRPTTAYLSSDLKAQIRPDNPLNLIMGIQNMYNGFTITGSDGTAGTMYVRATLGYTTQKEWSFALVAEDGAWRINQITPPPVEQPAPTAVPAQGDDAIFYVDPDGVTIKQISPNGGEARIIGSVGPASGPTITFMEAGPSGRELLVGQGTNYQLVNGGLSRNVGEFIASPRWSPDGTRLVGQSVNEGIPGPAYLYDLATKQGVQLPFSGAADWYPDGQHLVYAASRNGAAQPGSNVYRYDLATGASDQLSNLVSSANDIWYVQEAHVLPDSGSIVFYGNHTNEVGASGNGQQWWWIPAEGGEAQLFSRNYGNGINGYAASPDGTLIAYSSRAHVSACASAGDISVRANDVGGDPEHPLHPLLPILGEQTDTYAFVEGLSWSQESGRLAFALDTYTCQDAASGRVGGTPVVYVWDVAAGGAVATRAEFRVALGGGLKGGCAGDVAHLGRVALENTSS